MRQRVGVNGRERSCLCYITQSVRVSASGMVLFDGNGVPAEMLCAPSIWVDPAGFMPETLNGARLPKRAALLRRIHLRSMEINGDPNNSSVGDCGRHGNVRFIFGSFKKPGPK